MDVVRMLTPAEAAAYGLVLCEGWENYNIDPDRAADPLSIDNHLRSCWTKLEDARAALRSQNS
jgi:hypothetical protein